MAESGVRRKIRKEGKETETREGKDENWCNDRETAQRQENDRCGLRTLVFVPPNAYLITISRYT